MKIIKSIADAILDHKSGMKEATEILKKLDPQFSEIELHYQEAAEILKTTIGNSAEEYLDLREQSTYHEFLSLCWSGFHLNYSCFINPINSLALNEDFEFILQEQRLSALPQAKTASQFGTGFLKSIPQDKLELLEPIIEYYSYLQTVGYKIAHYWGYEVAACLFKNLVPGYSVDSTTAGKYRQKLMSYLNFNIKELE